MAIDWQSQINGLDLTSIISPLINGNNPPLTGSDFPAGHFSGADIPNYACAIQAWVQDNTPFYVDMVLRFKALHSLFLFEVYWQSDNTLAKSFGPTVVTGRSTVTGNFAGQHEKLGQQAFLNFAQWCADIINGG